MYIARQLSFHGVAFKIEEVPLSKEFEKVYDASVKLWVEAMQKFHEAAELVDAENRMRKTMWGQFWSAHQRFFKYLCIAAKVRFTDNLFVYNYFVTLLFSLILFYCTFSFSLNHIHTI